MNETKFGKKVVELFAGVGGFSLGLEKAGWEVMDESMGTKGKTSTCIQLS